MINQASYFPPRCRPTWVQVLHSSVWPSRKAKWDLRVSYETTNCILDWRAVGTLMGKVFSWALGFRALGRKRREEREGDPPSWPVPFGEGRTAGHVHMLSQLCLCVSVALAFCSTWSEVPAPLLWFVSNVLYLIVQTSRGVPCRFLMGMNKYVHVCSHVVRG